jgi:hypothetical protein
MSSVSQAIGRHFAVAVTSALSAVGCTASDFFPVLDIPIPPGAVHIRSLPFAIDATYAYYIGIGVDRMEVDEATCRAATYSDWIIKKAERSGHKLPPCHLLTPAIGAFTWRVSHNGKLVAQGSQLGLPPSPWAPNPHSVMPEKLTWQFFDAFHAVAGTNYILELDLQSGPASLEQSHPRLGIVKSFK